ncbi:MAG: multiprotein bridging factor aMBF1 [Candidatus Bathyarchaeota archaeon]
MDCEVCGNRIFGGKRSVIIDGARLIVCSKCAKSNPPAPPVSKNIATKGVGTAKIRQRQVATRENLITIREDFEVVNNYGALVREAREKIHLTHDELSRKVGAKVSVLQKFETGKMVPDLESARKLEYALKIKLLQPISRVPVDGEYTKPPTKLTLGDMVFVQEEKK